MSTYAFILGRKYLLSIAEICNLIKDRGRIIDVRKDTLIVSFKTRLDSKLLLSQIGGTIKIAEVISEISLAQKNKLAETISHYLYNKFQGHDGKVNYGISLYSFTDKHEIILRKTLNLIKKNLTVLGLKSRFINHNFKNLESAAIKGEKLLIKGSEIIAIQGTHRIFIAETQAIQDFENYSKRDYNRPARDPRLGMLPPKLAQIMINISGITPLCENLEGNKTLYDPFAGVGTILAEALLLGYNIMGSDINAEVLEKARKNLEWLRNENFNPVQKIKFFLKDATLLDKKDIPEKIDLIVTESYLGPPVSTLPSPNQIKKTFHEIQELILKFFQSLSKLLNPGTPIVISLLVYKGKNQYFFIDQIIEKILQYGFEISSPIPKEIKTKFNIPSPLRESLIYDRPDQIVAREIWKFIKK